MDVTHVWSIGSGVRKTKFSAELRFVNDQVNEEAYPLINIIFMSSLQFYKRQCAFWTDFFSWCGFMKFDFTSRISVVVVTNWVIS